ncbi:MAG: hypothetical protein E6L09_06720 [Verrucomicrobia bacterium]|nr:MAG: hypothetical protein E6L09_06720 [Verrucomicrobiota bacterium]
MNRFRTGLLLAIIAGFACAGGAAPARIMKVLPHLLDRDGRYSLSPSLYERDAYQALLRKSPEKCAGIRFDVRWKAQAGNRVKLRIDIRGSTTAEPLVLEQIVRRNHWYDRWTSLTLANESYQKVGEVIAWRATLWEGDKLLAERKSFLW